MKADLLIQNLFNEICKKTGFSNCIDWKKTRRSECVTVRAWIVYILKKVYHFNNCDIAKYIEKDRTTVIYLFNMINEELRFMPNLNKLGVNQKEFLNDIVNNIMKKHQQTKKEHCF